MSTFEKKDEILKLTKEYDISKDMYKKYYCPDIPEKVLGKLIKYFDSAITINSVVAFFDCTIMGSGKKGFVFLVDGFYYTDTLEKPLYVPYKDISDISEYYSMSGVNIKVELNNGEEYTFINVLDMEKLKQLLLRIKEIDEIYGQSSNKTAGKIKKLDIPEDIKKKCHPIIHGAAGAAGAAGAGLAQVVGSDNVVIVPIQIGMITALGKVFDLHVTEGMAKGIIASAGASIAGRTVSQVLVGWIPCVGNAINLTTAAGITEAIGWIAVSNFYNRWLEDKNKGRLEGKKEGYVEASEMYENKLRMQAEEFLGQIRDFQKEKDEYEKLLDEYEKYIDELEANNDSEKHLKETKDIYNRLKDLDNTICFEEKRNNIVSDNRMCVDERNIDISGKKANTFENENYIDNLLDLAFGTDGELGVGSSSSSVIFVLHNLNNIKMKRETKAFLSGSKNLSNINDQNDYQSLLQEYYDFVNYLKSNNEEPELVSRLSELYMLLYELYTEYTHQSRVGNL